MGSKTLTATERMKRSREATKNVAARDLLYAGILARLWPSWLMEPERPQDHPEMPLLLAVETPHGTIYWRLTEDEAIAFDRLERRSNDKGRSDKWATLYSLAMNGWQEK